MRFDMTFCHEQVNRYANTHKQPFSYLCSTAAMSRNLDNKYCFVLCSRRCDVTVYSSGQVQD